MRSQATRRKRKRDTMEVDSPGGIQHHSRDAWKSCRGWFGKTNRTKNTMTISTIGKKDKRPKDQKESYCLFGVWAMRKRRSMLHLLFGIQDTKIYSLYLLVVTISLSRRQDRYWFGHLKMLLSLSTNMKAYQLESCALIGILHHLLSSQLDSMTELFWCMMLEISTISRSMNQQWGHRNIQILYGKSDGILM